MACVTGASEQEARAAADAVSDPRAAADGERGGLAARDVSDRDGSRRDGNSRDRGTRDGGSEGTRRGEASHGARESASLLPRTATGSRLDELWQRVTGRIGPRTAELVLLLGVTLLAGITRFWQLAHPDLVVFDETFYLKDSWSLVQLGYESRWPENANDAWVAGNPNGYLTDPAFIVHPPLGKLIIGFGMMLFGADNPFGWRVAVAVVGTLSVALLWLTARRMFGSPALATTGAFLMAIDGHAIVTSRVSILDGILTFFLIAGVLLIMLDREQQRALLHAKVAAWRERRGPDADGEENADDQEREASKANAPEWGPALWWRPWLVAAAIAFACASAVKWSGLWFLAVFCVYTLVVDAIERRRLGIPLWFSAAVLKQGPVSFLLTIPVALAVYLVSWTNWLSTTGGYFRGWAEQPGNAWEGPLAWVPLPIQSLWHYSAEAYRFHTNLSADHPYQSPPGWWPFLIRPTAFSYVYSTSGDNPACETGKCVEAITSLANPLVWWAGTVAIMFLLIFIWMRPTWQFFVILAGYGAAYVPWLFQTQRQAVFQFYGIAMLPFMILAFLALLELALRTRDAPRPGRTAAIWSIAGFCGIALAISAWFYPVWTGMLISQDYWVTTQWLPGWR